MTDQLSNNQEVHLDKNKVVIGMSGGVDSTVAAYLLKKAGYDVIGITLRLWEDAADEFAEKNGGCCSLSAVDDARRVADKIGIPFYVLNFKDIFKKDVVDYFLDEYEAGRTPNPCIACNKFIKFDALIKKAHELGAYYVATGHYAKIAYDEHIDRYCLYKSASERKDQTYALYNLTQEQLKHMLMPLSDIPTKEEVRAIAQELDVFISEKKDSQEICFIPDDNYPAFIAKHRPKTMRKGKFVDTKGQVLGEHSGIANYTVGQRKGLGITFGKPMFVVSINPDRNEVVLGDNEEVFSKGLIGHKCNFIPFDRPDGEIRAMIKIRYSAPLAGCTVKMTGPDTAEIVFDEPQRAVTPGQAAVLYDGDRLVGGVTILKSI